MDSSLKTLLTKMGMMDRWDIQKGSNNEQRMLSSHFTYLSDSFLYNCLSWAPSAHFWYTKFFFTIFPKNSWVTEQRWHWYIAKEMYISDIHQQILVNDEAKYTFSPSQTSATSLLLFSFLYFQMSENSSTTFVSEILPLIYRMGKNEGMFLGPLA